MGFSASQCYLCSSNSDDHGTEMVVPYHGNRHARCKTKRSQASYKTATAVEGADGATPAR
jgi:hypothetical protein